MRRGTVPLASWIHRRTQIISFSISGLHNEWQIVFAFPIYPSCKYLNWKLHAQHSNTSLNNNYKKKYLFVENFINNYYIIIYGITVLSCFHSLSKLSFSSSIDSSSTPTQSSTLISLLSSSSSTYACPLELIIAFNSSASTSTKILSNTWKF
jgi:hypothetical protein